MSAIDLHTHSTASDGIDSPTALVDHARERGIAVLGLTDHDTVAGLSEAQAAASAVGLTLVPGVELSTTVDRGEVHILGYFVDPHNEGLQRAFADLRAARERRIERMIGRLQDLGYAIDREAVMRHAEGASVGRPHVARELMRIGVADSVDDAFRRFLTPGKPGYVPRDPVRPEQAVELLRSHGAIPVFAHPFSSTNVEGMLNRLIPAGLAGMEVWYAEYDDTQRALLGDIASARGLIATGGSDYHGAGVRAGRELGAAPVPYAIWEDLQRAHARLARA